MIALSIVSASSDEPGSSKESVLRTAYSAARIAVETANDSSAMRPPLKAVMGALSVLIKNCDVSSSHASRSPDR